MSVVQYISEDKARMSRVFCLAKGLFRSLRKGERAQPLDIQLDIEGASIRFQSPESLGVDEMRVLQAVVGRATRNGGLELDPHPISPRGVVLKERLDRLGWTFFDSTLLLESSQRVLSNLAGYSKKTADKKHIRTSLDRLSQVWMTVRQGDKEQRFQILHWQKPETASRKMTIILNPITANAVWGGQYTYLSLSEIRRLRTDAARLIHQRLCGYINVGKSRRVGVAKLLSYVWPEATSSVDNQRRRLRHMRLSLEEIAQLGWKVVCIDNDVYTFRRPAFKKI